MVSHNFRVAYRRIYLFYIFIIIGYKILSQFSSQRHFCALNLNST